MVRLPCLFTSVVVVVIQGWDGVGNVVVVDVVRSGT